MNTNVTKEILLAMERQGFSENSIKSFKESEAYVKSYSDAPEIQKTVLTMYFFNLLMYKKEPIPVNIRIGLNAATEYQAWLDDMITIVLPFIRANEEVFYS